LKKCGKVARIDREVLSKTLETLGARTCFVEVVSTSPSGIFLSNYLLD